MDRQNRLLTALAVVLLALVAVVVIDKPEEGEEKGDHHSPPTSSLFDYESDQIAKVSVRSSTGAIRFEKVDSKWTMVEPRQVPVEQRKVADIVERLKTTKVEERELPGQLADYGLDEGGRVLVELQDAAGKSWAVYVGADAPVGYRSYIMSSPEGPARTASTKLGDLVPRDADEYRSKELWTLSSGSAKRVRILVDGVETVLRKDDHGWWLGDKGPRADDEKVNDWFSKAAMVKAARFLDGQDPATLGLDAPSATLTVEDADGTHELRFGRRGPEGAAVQGSGLVHVGSDGLALLEAREWLATKLMPVRTWQIDKLQIELGGKSATWTKKEGKWTGADGAESALPTELLGAIREIPARRTESPELGTPSGRIVLGEGESRTETVVFGNLAGSDRVAQDTAGGGSFLVPQAELDALAAKL